MDELVPVIGARTRAQLAEIPVALKLQLTPEDLERIEGEVLSTAVAGTRYAEQQMRQLDSER